MFDFKHFKLTALLTGFSLAARGLRCVHCESYSSLTRS